MVTKVTSDFVSRIGFYLSTRLVLLFFFMDSKNSLYGSLSRARIGLEIIYSRLSLSVMAEIGRNCAISAFCCLGMIGIGQGMNSPNSRKLGACC